MLYIKVFVMNSVGGYLLQSNRLEYSDNFYVVLSYVV